MIPVELVDPRYYHLDTCFCPLAPDTAIWYPPAFDDYGQRAIEEHVPKLLPSTKIGSRTIRLQRGGDRPARSSRTPAATACTPRWPNGGYEPTATPLDEFVKAGGSAKCLTCGSMAKRQRAGESYSCFSSLS